MTLAAEEPDWLGAARQRALVRFAELGLPTDAAEIWRYSRIDGLDLDRYLPAAGPGAGAGAGAAGPPGAEPLPAVFDGLLEAVSAGTGRPPAVVAVRDGLPAIPAALPEGVTVAGPGAEPWPEVAPRDDAFAALNQAHAPGPLRIHIGAGAAPDTTVVVAHWVQAGGAASFPRLLITADPQAEARVVEVAASPDLDALVVPVTEIDLAAGARLAYVSLQLLGPRVWQVGLQASRVGRDATLTAATVAFGGSYARMRTDSSTVGQGASSRLLAVWFGSGRQMHDLRTVQAHTAPRTASELLFKGVVANQSHSVYTGVIRVDKGARGTNAMQTNRNLVLDDGAHADSVPNLEIEDNDVHCSHASAVGPIDGDQRFYLESRGVPTEAADRLIAQGFLDEVIERVPVPGLGGWLRAQVAGKLAEAEAAR